MADEELNVPDQSDPVREALHAAIQQNPPPATVFKEGGVLTGWVIVAEWMVPDGGRVLSQMYDGGTTIWKRDGMLRYVVDTFGALDDG